MKYIVIILISFFSPLIVAAREIALISDIHSGTENKIYKKFGEVIYPKNALKVFKEKIQEIKNKNISLLVVLGDSTQKNSLKRFKKLVAAANGLETIWVKGNHDGNYWLFQEKQKYDYGDFQIITLDSNSQFPKDIGYLTNEQKDFVLENLNKPSIIALHHPFYACDSTQVVSDYADFKNELENSGKVIAVISGHCHRPIYHVSGGVKYIGVQALTSANNYYLLETENTGRSAETGLEFPAPK